MLRGIVLLGFMGAGKTTVGRALAARLVWPFIDLDDYIATREQQAIRDIFLQRGEAGFRAAESEALQEVLSKIRDNPHVLALGGGAALSPFNWASLQSSGLLSIFLDAPVDELWERSRLEQMDRPLRRDKAKFRKLNETRRPSYLRAALTTETGGKRVDTVVEEILRHVRPAMGKEPGETITP